MPELLFRNSPPDDLPCVLEQKLIAYEEFLSATLLLKEHLLSEDMIQIDSVIGQRHGLIGRIDDLDDRIKNLTMRPGTALLGRPLDKGGKIDLLTTTLEETITKVIRINEECAAVAAKYLDELEKELTVMNTGRLALRGYAGGAGEKGNNRSPRFLSISA